MAMVMAAGTGKRFSGRTPKQYTKVAGRELLAHAIAGFEKSPAIKAVLVVAAPGYVEFVKKKIVKKYRFKKVIDVIPGGAERYDSVLAGVEYLKKNLAPETVLIHDGARPFFDGRLITAVLKELKKHPAAIPVKPIHATVKLVYDGYSVKTMDRNHLHTSHTPQGFRFDLLSRIYTRHMVNRVRPTDEAALFEKAGYKVRIIEDTGFNLKVTTKEDLDLLKFYLHKT